MADTVSVKEFSKAWWCEVLNRIIGAVVFIDDPSAECLHWDGGLSNFVNGGAVAVKTLSPFEFAMKDQKKGVFICQCTSNHLQSVKAIIDNSDFTHCILISTVSLDIIFGELDTNKDISDVVTSGRVHNEATKLLEGMLLQWINKEQSAVEVVHVPIFAIPISEGTFLTPPYSDMYPWFNGKLQAEESSIDLYTLSSTERAQLRRLASNLNCFLESVKLKEDVFFMGPFSSLLAGILENSPICTARKKTCSNPASLILVDRTLDLCGVTTHTTDSLFDKVISVLPRFPGHATDVAVNMSPLCETNVLSSTDYLTLSPGCMYHALDKACCQTFEYMIHKSQKEVMFHIYNRLSKIDLQRSPSHKTLMKVTPQSVEKIVNSAQGNYAVITENLGLLQQALGAVQTLKSSANAQIELMASLERQVIQNITTSRESTSVLNQICHLIKTRKDKSISLESIMALLVNIYSLVGNEISFLAHHEDNLMQTLSVAIFEDHKTLFPYDDERGHVAAPEDCEIIAKSILLKLKAISQSRNNLLRYNSVLRPNETGSAQEYRGVLQQLVDDLFNPNKIDLIDLKHRTDGIKDLLRSGLNILRTSKNQRATKHPLDNPVVIIFVIGGISAEELKRLHRSVITSGSDVQVVIGSTKLVSPLEVTRTVLEL